MRLLINTKISMKVSFGKIIYLYAFISLLISCDSCKPNINYIDDRSGIHVVDIPHDLTGVIAYSRLDSLLTVDTIFNIPSQFDSIWMPLERFYGKQTKFIYFSKEIEEIYMLYVYDNVFNIERVYIPSKNKNDFIVKGDLSEMEIARIKKRFENEIVARLKQ